MGHDKKKYGKITEMHPNAITHFRGMFLNLEKHRLEDKYTTQFFSRNEYALRLQKVFYPIWLLFHAWDVLIANPFKPAWNLGFDTLTAYPGDNGADDPVDGYTLQGVNDDTWANIRDGAGNASGYSGETGNFIVKIQNGQTTGFVSINRSIYCFDTSALTVGATISATVLSLYGLTKADGVSISLDLDIYTSTPASTTSLVNGDYTQIGITSQTGGAIAYASIVTSAYNDFTFNATGRGNVSKTSISKFGIRNANRDVADSEPGYAGSYASSHFTANYSDNATNKPKLVVTYTTGTDYFKTCSETIAINDTLLNKTIKTFSETISIVDSISIQKTLKRTLSEAITIADNLNAKKIAVKTFSEIISITDTIKKSIGKVLTEMITIVDSIIFGKVFARTYSEAITIVDSILIARSRTLSEIISIFDTIVKKTSKTLSEIITIVDSIVTRKILNKILSDVITIADTVKSRTARTLSEAITIADSISKITAQVLSETITLTESLYMKLNGVNVKWIRKYSEKVGSFTRKYSEKVGTFIKKYYKDI